MSTKTKNGNVAAESAEPKEPMTGKTKMVSDKLVQSQEVEWSDGFDQKDLLRVLMEMRSGNFNVRMPIDQVGINGKICDTLNDIISLNEKMIEEFTKAGNTIGKQGKLTQRI